MQQNFEVSVEGISVYDADTKGRVKINGSLITADYAENAAVEKIIRAEQNGQPLSVLWMHHAGTNQHRFTIEEVKRKNGEEKVILSWSGEPLKVENSSSQEITIPPLKEYKVLSSRLVSGEEHYISVLFSDPLLEKQDLKGLITLQGSEKAPRAVIQLNELKIYPAELSPGQLTLRLFKEIKNATGASLKEDYSTTFTLAQANPEVRVTESYKGVILPSSNGLVLPFEAIGLREVDITIVKIFKNNALQYLQNNAMGETAELKRVGRPVARKKIPLNTSGVVSLEKWNRFTLDLSTILQAEPGAIYQVKIGFRKSQALYFCPENEQESVEEQEENWDFNESSYWDEYENYSYDYDWSQRNNPCSPSYYRNKEVSKLLFASDLGIIAKKADKGALQVFVTNLLSTSPQEEVNVKVYDYQQQLIAEAVTDQEGKADIKVNGNPFVLLVSKGQQSGYLKLTDGSSLSLSNFDVTGQPIQQGVKGFIYGERGVWRPGDTLHLSFMLEDKLQKLPASHPVILEVWNARGQLTARKVQSGGLEGLYSFSIPTEAEAPTGNWEAKVKVGGAEFRQKLKVETVKPNRLKIDLNFGKTRLTALDKEIAGDLHIRWLHGAKARNLKAEFQLLLSPTKTTFNGYNGFSFDDASKEYYAENQLVFEGNVDSEGYAKVNIKMKAGANAPGALKAVFKGKAFEEGGDFSVDQFSIPYYPYSSFVGIKAPEGDKKGLLLTDQDHNIRIVSVDAQGKPVNRDHMKVELYKLNWKWWWDNSYENLSNYVGRSYHTPVQESVVSTRNGEGTWALRINHPAWGRYYLKVTDPVSGHSAGQVVALDWPGWATGKKGELDGASMLSFTTEKEEYRPGEKIRLQIPSSPGGRALVSLETGSRMLQSYWVETRPQTTEVVFEATADMAPNVYINISMLQPHAQTQNDLPIRLYGVQSVKVVNPATRLEPLINLAAELRPEAPFTVTVQEKEGKAMAYTLAVVEEGLLDLTRFKTPDPWQAFYAREALGVKTWDIYDEVIGAQGGSIERLLAIGGDDEIKKAEKKEVNRFKPVVKFLGPFYLEAGKKAQHQLKMPQYIGSVRTMVVAARQGAYGSAEATSVVKQPLMVLATLPRVAGPGEEIVLPVNVFAGNADIRQVKVTVKTSGLLKPAGATTQTITFNQPGDQLAYFALRAEEALGNGKVVVTATAGGLEATYDVELKVRASNPFFLQVTDTLLAASEGWTTNYKPIGIAGTNEAVLELSTLPPLNLEQRLQYLIQYPHGCVEQTTSAVFAQLYLEKLSKLSQDRKAAIEQNIQAAISRLKSFQLPSGGFAYWPGNSSPDAWGTNYAGHFLLEAKKRGYHVPEEMISSWKGYQQQQAGQWVSGPAAEGEELVQAYRLHTLALAASPSIGAMNRMKERLQNPSAKWRLALAYALAGYANEAAKLVDGISKEALDHSSAEATYGSVQRDQAMVMETLLHIGRNTEAFELLQSIAAYMGNQAQWMSTQTTAYALIAIAEYAEKNKLDEKIQAQLSINGKKLAVESDKFIYQHFLQNPEQQQNLQITNQGSATVFTRLISRGVPLQGQEKEEARNLRVNVVYKNMKGEEIDVTKISQGTDFVASVTVHNPSSTKTHKEMALHQLFPSGWEIINNRLHDSPKHYGQGAPDYQDVRDDRVYTYFDMKPNSRKEFTILLNASYRGRYYLPAVVAEAMYDNSVYASKAGQWVEVLPE